MCVYFYLGFMLFGILGAQAPAVFCFVLAVIATPGLNRLVIVAFEVLGALALGLMGRRALRDHDERKYGSRGSRETSGTCGHCGSHGSWGQQPHGRTVESYSDHEPMSRD